MSTQNAQKLPCTVLDSPEAFEANEASDQMDFLPIQDELHAHRRTLSDPHGTSSDSVQDTGLSSSKKRTLGRLRGGSCMGRPPTGLRRLGIGSMICKPPRSQGNETGSISHASLADSLALLNARDFLEFTAAYAYRLPLTPENHQETPSTLVADDESFSARVPDYVKTTGASPYSLELPPQLPPVIFISGGGIFYFWKAGFLSYLTRHFDLSQSVFVGTSAGALVSALACCHVDIGWASRLAIHNAMRALVWEKSSFLAGVLSRLTETWLEYVLPKTLDMEDLRSRLVLTAFRVSRLRLEGLCRFADRQDVIACLLASIHIPFYANGKGVAKARGLRYVDGGFGADLLDTFANGLRRDQYLIIRCSEEEDETKAVPRRECIRKRPPAGMFELLHRGFAHAERLHRAGRLALLKRFETHPPGSFLSQNDPYFDATRVMDEELNQYCPQECHV